MKVVDVICTCMFQDNNGYIDANELKTTMNQVGMRLTDQDVRDMMQEAGVDYNGRIFYEGQAPFSRIDNTMYYRAL